MIDAENLTRKFGDLIAVDNVTFHVAEGEVFGLLSDLTERGRPPRCGCSAASLQRPAEMRE